MNERFFPRTHCYTMSNVQSSRQVSGPLVMWPFRMSPLPRDLAGNTLLTHGNLFG